MCKKLKCSDCGAVFEKPGSRGRDPKRCAPCSADYLRSYSATCARKQTCKRCGGEFGANSQRSYCSKACRDADKRDADVARSIKNTRTCQYCGENFVPRLMKYSKYCSRACAFADCATHKHRASSTASPDENWKKASRVYFRKCEQCGVSFTAKHKQTRLCSPECKTADAAARYLRINMSKHVEEVRTCPECRKEFANVYGEKLQKFCSTVCSKRYHGRIYKMRRKAITRGVGSERIDPYIVFDIYGWECYSCKTPTPKHLRGTYEDAAPELDHIVPLAKGGAHTYTNVQLLCRKCNGSKSDTLCP